MAYSQKPTQEDTRLSVDSDREIELRQYLNSSFYPTLPDWLVDDIVRAFSKYWRKALRKQEVFKITKMKSYADFEGLFEDFLER